MIAKTLANECQKMGAINAKKYPKLGINTNGDTQTNGGNADSFLLVGGEK